MLEAQSGKPCKRHWALSQWWHRKHQSNKPKSPQQRMKQAKKLQSPLHQKTVAKEVGTPAVAEESAKEEEAAVAPGVGAEENSDSRRG